MKENGRRSPLRASLASVVFPAIALAVVVPLILWRISIFNSFSKSEDSADDALSQASAMQTMFADSANDMHGFILTGSASFLNDYLTNERSIGDVFGKLDSLAGIDARQLQNARQIQDRYFSWHAQADAAIAARQQGGKYPSTRTVMIGSERMRALRSATRRFVDAERAERADFASAAHRSAATATIVALFGTILVVCVLLFGTRQAVVERRRQLERDREEQDQLEEAQRRGRELFEQNLRIQESARLKSEFVANMSHELRTPLTAILGLGEMLRDEKAGPQNDKQQAYLDDILSSGRHLLKLINDVLDLAKIEAGRPELIIEPADPAEIAREVVEIVRPLADRKQISVTVDSRQSPPKIFTDASRFRQILYNYLSNAIKFTPPGGRVTVRLINDRPGCLRLEVQDTGIGIASSDIPKLFVEFSQLDSGTSKSHDGAGLGLALTKRLVEAQGGSVGVRSVVGTGSTFIASLPIAAGDELEPSQKAGA